MDMLKTLYNFFPTAVFTGRNLILVSENWRVEFSEHKDCDYSKGQSDDPPIIRVKLFKKALDGYHVPDHHEDFQLASPNELAEQIEKYVEMAIGINLKEIV